MEINSFKSISVRGRMAYAICCLESAISKAHNNSKAWDIILNQLWTYTEKKYLDEWHEITAEFIPDTILEYTSFNQDDFEFLSRSEFDTLSKLYKGSEKHICDIINHIFELGSVELYGKLTNEGVHVLNELMQIIVLMNKYEIPLPDFISFTNYSFNENNGWGKTFKRDQICC